MSPRFLLPSLFANRKQLTRSIHAQYNSPFPRRADREGPYALARALRGSDSFYRSFWERRQEVRQPMTLVWGERDPAFNERHLRRFQEAFPHALVTGLPVVGHFVAEEAPGAVVAAIRSDA